MTQKILLLVCLLSSFALLGCDGDNPTDLTGPDTEIDFECFVAAPNILECVAQQFAGIPPLVYRWESKFLNPQSAAGKSSVTWDYQRVCATQAGAIGVSISLSITEEDGRGKLHGPVAKAYEICGKESSASGQSYLFQLPLEPKSSGMSSIPRYHNRL